MKRITITPPTKRELVTLWVMIFIGCVAIVFFLCHVLNPAVRGHVPLYWMLMVTFVFTCLKLLYEWYHYLFITVPKTPPLTTHFTVDIFTTFCAGEPYEMIVETLEAVKAITYPHETYLCDEANDPFLKEVCQELGVHHITRTNRTDAKAGNINNALKQSAGELCVVLDPDHVPAPDFLDPIVPHFANPEIGYVQIVQAYKNGNESLIAKGAAQQTYQFYGPIMMTMNKYGTVLAIGANCTFRRTALDSIGGHAAGLAEDLHTAMQLHAQGWKSVYVPEIMARGLVPSTLSAYYRQQLKWSRGVFDLLVTAYPKLFSRFTWRQKLHYALLPMHYLSGVIFLINFLIPVIALCFGASPMQMDISEFGLAVFPLIASIVLIRHFVQWWVMEDEERGFHMVGGLLLIGTWWVFILGLVYTIAGKKVPYVPTPKDGNEANNWPLNIPNLFIFAISAFAIGYGLLTDWNPYNLVMAGFAGLNCLFMCFTIAASRQQQFRFLRAQNPRLNALMGRLKIVKDVLWILRHRVYTGLRSTAMLVMFLLVGVWIYNAKFKFLENESDYHRHERHGMRRPLGPGNVLITSETSGREAAMPDLLPPNPSGAVISFKGMRGVNYLKGSDWKNEYEAFTKKELVSDFKEMKRIGINTVKFYGPGIYDRNILSVAGAQGMNLHYGFWVPSGLDFKKDKQTLEALSQKILLAVGSHKANRKIFSWNIGNAVFQNLRFYYLPRDLADQQDAYLVWLKKLVSQMKKVDPSRPITLDIQASETMHAAVARIRAAIPGIASYGLVYYSNAAQHKMPENFPHFTSYAEYDTYTRHSGDSAGVFISNWQDVHAYEKVTFDGLKDGTGRRKISMLQLAAKWHGHAKTWEPPKTRILRPAAATVAGLMLDYHAVIRKDGNWSLAKDLKTSFKFEWKLVQMDDYFNLISSKDVGTGTDLSLQIPPDPETYRLYLFVLEGNVVIDIIDSSLNTPLLPEPHSGH
ncbi:glycosyltransferase family 2 protein [Dyadobacter sandarakinus]|uniref:Glycosyltransferase n=1 Tax=Dyadobacter sandarakinus TaxID=2747268 RepID=A0ABX7I3M9_9BACT|nr:cellulose synthase catalytic subunit [Dyadobacter sandarakinus]QRR00172.1 glycosyltransferase [Dyadobacter sandarakinus]